MNMKLMIYYIVILVLLCGNLVFAQRSRNYIYLFDCTKSMTGFNGTPNIWEKAKEYVRTDIERYMPGTSIHVLPFQNQPLNPHSFSCENFDWSKIENDLDEYVNNVTRTNICGALNRSESFIDPNKDNYIYLLTDGEDNEQGISVLAQKLQNFCGKHKNTRLFYIVLTQNAINPTIQKVVDACSTEFFVDVTKKMNPFGSFDEGTTIYANTLKLDKVHKIPFSAAGKFSAKTSCTDPNFSVTIEDEGIKDGVLLIKISPRKSIQEINASLPETYEFAFDVQSADVEVINPTIRVVMTNKVERNLDILDEEKDMGSTEWYDAFLFWKEKEQDTLKIDLMARFNDEARKDGSAVTLKISNRENENDYTLLFNGDPIKNGLITINAKEQEGKAELSVVFDKDAQNGKRYFDIEIADRKNLESVNGAPVGEYAVSLRSKYDVVWNPLKTILMWLCITILTLLVLWFIVLKNIIYSYTKIGRIIVKSPYYTSLKIKGARKIIFSNKPVKQSVFNRFFTGRIANNVNECWTQNLVLEPSKNKTLRISEGRKTYTFTPYDSKLKVNSNYEILNTEQGGKIEILINQ